MRIHRKVAIVTGGASGLGAAVVSELRAAQATVSIVDRASTNDADSQEADVTDAVQLARAVESVLSRHNRLDIAVHCAGIGHAGRMLGKQGPMALEEFERVIRVNLVGTFNLARLAAQAMSRNEPDEHGERGVIVMTSSIAAFDGQIGQIPYAASKAAVAGMTLPMAREMARHAIRVVSIAPGVFDTPLLAALPEDARKSLAAGIPFPQELGDPPQFSALVRHIIENRYLNGEVIRLDGALRMPPK
jgi:3-hydroxyacyl-CoA dehydrogenase / 3-hydroxy-2-methylbutyryl-CoA dehydrogenase